MTNPRNSSATGEQRTLSLTASRSFLKSLVPKATPSFEHSLVRPDDQLRLRFELINGEIKNNKIVALLGEEPVYYAISFGPQHLVEEPIPKGKTPPAEALASRISGESRVVVEIESGIDFTVATLLDLAAYTLQLDDRADPSSKTTNKAEPVSTVTAIEVPTSLVLSPTPGETFVADAEPITHGDITELWRARLARVDRDDQIPRPAISPLVRAIWSRPEDPEFDRPVAAWFRENLVNQTTGKGSLPIAVHRLWLSSQGAFLDADGAWANGVLAAYRHRVVTGRDLHVEEVVRGYLAPFGIAASITTLTERVFLTDKNGELTTASLITEEFMAVTASSVGFTDTDGPPYIPSAGRGLPFARVSASDPGSGPIGDRQVVLPNGSSINRNKARILTRDGEDLRITYTVTDRSGQGGISLDLPVVFVSDSEAYEPEPRVDGRRTVLHKLKHWYANDANVDFSVAELNGQAIAWAESLSAEEADRGGAGSVQTTNRIRFRLDRPEIINNNQAAIEDALRDASRPAFYPAVERAWIVDLSSTTVMGGDPPETEVTVAQRYLDSGLSEANVDLGYLDLVDPIQITPTTNAKGMISTNLLVETFGQRFGAGTNLLTDPDDPWQWNPSEALAGLPQLLGNLTLANIVGEIDLTGNFTEGALPKMEIAVIPGADILDPPTGVCVLFSWEPQLKSFPTDKEASKTFVIATDLEDAGLPADAFGGKDTHALLSLETCTPGDETFEASLERFALQVPPFIPVVAILFERVRFRNVNGSSTVETNIADWFFINQLGWLEPVKDFLLDTLGMGAPTFEGGIFVNVDQPIPGLTFGIVGVHGMQVKLGIDLPDTGASSVDFGISSRDDPFTITVFGVGGTGSFALVIDAQQIVLIEGSLAVTFEIAVNVFIAAASLSVALGVFILYEKEEEEEEVTLGAYATLSGSLSFIGIVKITGTVTVALIYKVHKKLLRGVAAVTGEVSSPFGKSSVTHDVEVEVDLGDKASGKRRISITAAGDDDADPASFQDRYDENQWTEYCNAFAE